MSAPAPDASGRASGPLLLVDLPWVLYRSHFALPSKIRGADGEPIGALQGMVQTVLSEIDVLAPRAVCCATGAEDAEHRVRLLPAYHAHRDPMPTALRRRWDQAPALCEALGWAVRDGGACEADDVLATLARRRASHGGAAVILTGDRDLLACVGERVVVRRPAGRGAGLQTIGATGVREQLGVDPAQVGDLIALRGDPSDGIPGCPGIGAKTAARLLEEHGDLDRVVAAATGGDALPGALTPRIAAALRDHATDLRRDRALAALVEVDVEPVPDRATDRSGGAAACEALGMTRLATRLESA